MSTTNPAYVFDPYGREPRNLIRGERHTITAKNNYDFNYIIPTYAPFFTNDFKLYTVTQAGAKQYLTEGVDYIFAMRFIQAQTMAGKIIYGAVQFINRRFAGDVFLEYRTLGGDWLLSKERIREIIADWEHNPATSSWEQVANIPYQFPTIDHSHDVEDLTTVKDLIVEIRKLSSANEGNIEELIRAQLNNIVGQTVTKASIGLGNVQNLPILPINNGSNRGDRHYVTPRGVIDIIDNYIKPTITNHINAKGNVHGLTIADLNGYTKQQVDNLLREKLGATAKAVDAEMLDGMDSLVLKNWVLEGTVNNTIRFNSLTYPEMIEDVKNNMRQLLDEAIVSTNQTLSLQLKNLTAGNATKFDNKTPGQFLDWMMEQVLDADTLGGETKEQIIEKATRAARNASTLGGSTKEEIIRSAKTDVDAVRLAGKTLAEIKDEMGQNLSATTLNGKTIDQLIDDIKAEISGDIDAATLDGRTADEIINEAKNNVTLLNGLNTTQLLQRFIEQASGKVNAGTINGMTPDALIESLKSHTVNNANRLGGQTLEQVIAQANAKAADVLYKDFVNMGDGPGQVRPVKKATGSDYTNILSLGWSTLKQIKASVDNVDLGYLLRVQKTLGVELLDDLHGTEFYGVYAQGNGNNVTVERGYPVESRPGTLFVLPSSGNGTQVYITSDTHDIYIRNRTATLWSKWSKRSVSEEELGGKLNLTANDQTINGNLGVNGVFSLNTDHPLVIETRKTRIGLYGPHLSLSRVDNDARYTIGFQPKPTGGGWPINKTTGFYLMYLDKKGSYGSDERYIHFPSSLETEFVAYRSDLVKEVEKLREEIKSLKTEIYNNFVKK